MSNMTGRNSTRNIPTARMMSNSSISFSLGALVPVEIFLALVISSAAGSEPGIDFIGLAPVEDVTGSGRSLVY